MFCAMIRLDLLNPDMAISLKFALSHSLLSPAPCMLNRNFLIFVLKDALLIFGEYNPGSLWTCFFLAVQIELWLWRITLCRFFILLEIFQMIQMHNLVDYAGQFSEFWYHVQKAQYCAKTMGLIWEWLARSLREWIKHGSILRVHIYIDSKLIMRKVSPCLGLIWECARHRLGLIWE